MGLAKRFFKLSIHDKCRVLYLDGEFLMAIRYYGHKVNLYKLEDKLIEVFYDHKENKITEIASLDFGSKRMNFYLDQVKIDSTVLPY